VIEPPHATLYPTFAQPTTERPIHAVPTPIPIRLAAALEPERLVPVFDETGRTVS
jgi:hypothetical protein